MTPPPRSVAHYQQLAADFAVSDFRQRLAVEMPLPATGKIRRPTGSAAPYRKGSTLFLVVAVH
jgi:hypothetical protein